MQIVEALSDARVCDSSGRPAYTLHSGCRYALYDDEARRGYQASALKLIGTLDRRLPMYAGEPLAMRRILLPFIGRLGDAVMAASCIASAEMRHPGLRVDIACRPAAREVFDLVQLRGERLPYPITAGVLDDYDYHMSFEDVERFAGNQEGYLALFSRCLRLAPPDTPAVIRVPSLAKSTWKIRNTIGPHVGIHVGRSNSPRSYPRELLPELVDALLHDGCSVFLLGHDEEPGRKPFLEHERIKDLRGCTAETEDLAAVVSQLDVMVTGDSFPLHLAGCLGLPAVLFLTTTTSTVAVDYESVTVLPSRTACSPCHVADGECPIGHRQCLAAFDPSLHPRRIANEVHASIGAHSMTTA